MTDFGTDLDLWPDVNPAGSTVNGTTCLAQALLRRLTTPRGALFYDAGYGTDIRQYVGESMTPNSSAAAQTAIEREVTQDERVLAATATVTYNSTTNTLQGHLVIQTANGPFTLDIAVSAVTVTLLKAG